MREDEISEIKKAIRRSKSNANSITKGRETDRQTKEHVETIYDILGALTDKVSELEEKIED